MGRLSVLAGDGQKCYTENKRTAERYPEEWCFQGDGEAGALEIQKSLEQKD